MIRTLAGTEKIPRTLMVVGALALMGVLFAVWSGPAHASTFTVTNTTDDTTGGSLRAAINAANANAGADTINFNISGTGVKTITPTSPLPDITEAVTIDGYTQGAAQPNTLATGSDAVLLIELNATNVSNGLAIDSSGGGSTIRGLVINRAGNADIQVDSGSNVLDGNFIGVDPTGNSTPAGGFAGISIGTGANNLIGGTTPAARNVVSVVGSSNEIMVGATIPGGTPATGTIIRGNYVGTNASGTAKLADFANGIAIGNANDTTIGGSDATDGATDGKVGARNVVSGNSRGIYFYPVAQDGVTISGNFVGVDATGVTPLGNGSAGIAGSTASLHDNVTIGGTAVGAGNVLSSNYFGFEGDAQHLTVQGNFIGTDLSGTLDLGNTTEGVRVATAGCCPAPPPNGQIAIGGSTVAARNIISGNAGGGVRVTGSSTSSVSVQGNYIGTQADGQTALPNDGDGVRMSRQAAVGGTGAGEGNVIAHNGGNGVVLETFGPPYYSSPILRNSIFSNGGLGIDLLGDNVTANDPGDGDTGPNERQNFPVITAASVSGGSATVSGTLNSTASMTFRLEFFASASCNASAPNDYGEGQTFVGSTSVTTNADGNASFTSIPLNNLPTGQSVITSTATDPNNNTSEFSKCLTADVAANGPPVAKDDPDTPGDPNYTTNEGSPLTVSAANGVLSNDTDPDGDTLTVATPRPVSGPSNGTLTLNADGSFTYTPNAGFSGTDSFTYKANDGTDDSNTATVTITVNVGNDGCTITGTEGDDVLPGTSGGDVVCGKGGNDTISGIGGSDRLFGDSGNDTISGGTGRDIISGGTGSDRISARDRQRDRITCGSGRDRVIADRIDQVSGTCERVSRR